MQRKYSFGGSFSPLRLLSGVPARRTQKQKHPSKINLQKIPAASFAFNLHKSESEILPTCDQTSRTAEGDFGEKGRQARSQGYNP